VDYCQGSFGKPWKIPSPGDPRKYAGVAVLASHGHGDHFTPGILSWRRERADIEYVLSEDIRPAAEKALARVAGGKAGGSAGGGAAGAVAGCGNGSSSAGGGDDGGAEAGNSNPAAQHGAGGSAGGGAVAGSGGGIVFLSPGRSATAAGAAIKAYGSTDLGVSFHIATEGGVSIFHAGDLNFWHWADESTAAEVDEARAAFMRELALVKEGAGGIDVALFPVDPRLRTDYWRGAVMFCEAVRPKFFIPMHFQGAFAHPQAFYDDMRPYADVIKIDRELQRLHFDL
jgi:L-ascorbate metabolism protein UlaG (beta-lactamase superfamily)